MPMAAEFNQKSLLAPTPKTLENPKTPQIPLV